MEFLFRRHFWIIHLLFIFGVTLLLARTFNAFVESWVMPVSQPPERAARVISPVAAAPGLDAQRVSKLTGLPLPKEPEIKEPKETVDMDSEPVHTTLRVKLLGTLLSGIPEWSIASIQDATSLKTQTYMKGDLVQNAEVLEIERSRVIVKNNGRREYIDGNSGDGSGAPPPVAAAPVASAPAGNSGAPPSVALGNSIRAVSENEYEVPRAEIDKTLSNLNDVAMQARIVPAFKDGVAQGFKLFSIRPDSIYTKIGVQNGDVLKRINGYDLNSPEKALEVYSKLKEAARIDIEIDRNGSTVRKTYNVR